MVNMVREWKMTVDVGGIRVDTLGKVWGYLAGVPIETIGTNTVVMKRENLKSYRWRPPWGDGVDYMLTLNGKENT